MQFRCLRPLMAPCPPSCQTNQLSVPLFPGASSRAADRCGRVVRSVPAISRPGAGRVDEHSERSFRSGGRSHRDAAHDAEYGAVRADAQPVDVVGTINHIDRI
jgi:hypothetical protein